MSTTFVNPLAEGTLSTKAIDPCIVVIFGATGDLTARKLIPALYNLAREGQLPAHFACVGFARRDKSNEQFRDEMHEAVNKFSRVKPVDKALWDTFSEQLFYHRSEFDDESPKVCVELMLDKVVVHIANQVDQALCCAHSTTS